MIPQHFGGTFQIGDETFPIKEATLIQAAPLCPCCDALGIGGITILSIEIEPIVDGQAYRLN